MKNLTHIRSALIAFSLLLIGWCSSDAVAGGRVPFRHYSITSGLPHENVKAMGQTADGRLWIGTSAGLSVFDGYTFVDIPFAGLASPASVYEVEALPNGALWVATEDHGVWRVQDNRAVQPLSELASEHIHRFALRGDSLYFFGKDRLWAMDLDTETLIERPYRFVAGTPQRTGIISADIAPDGTFWVLDARLGPGRMQADGTIVFREEHLEMDRSAWRFLRFDMYGTGWVTHRQEGLYRLEDDGSLHLVLAAHGAEHICVTPDRIAVASGHMGGLMWDLEDQTPLMPLNVQRGMPTNRINCLFRDQEGNTWIGTQDGLIQLINPGVEHVVESAGLPLVELRGVARAADGSVWALSRTEGPALLSPQSEQTVPSPRVSGWWTSLIEGHDGVLYALERDAWYRYDQGNWQALGSIEDALAGVVDSAGAAYIKHSDGLYSYRAGRERVRLMAWPDVDQGYYQHTLAPDGRLIVWENGRVCEVAKEPSADTGQVETIVLADYPALRGAGVRALAMDRDRRLWVSLQGRGLYAVQGDAVLYVMPDMEVDRIEQLNDSLMAVDAHDGLHAFTNRQIANGMRRIRNGKAIKEAIPARYLLGQADGLLSSIVTGTVVGDQALWIAHPGGVTRMPLEVFFRELPHPNVLLTAISRSGVRNDPNQPLRFTARDRNVGFSFSTSSFAHQHRVYYRYRLRGFDNMWRETDDNTVQYTDLPAGDYEFEVQAGLVPNVFSRPVSYPFDIPSPFHENPIVWAGAFMMFLGGLYGVHRYRVRNLLQLERTRTQIAMDLHDDIGSSLMSLSLLSSMARQRSERSEEVTPILQEIGQTASTLVDSMSDIVWAIDPQQDTFRSVIERLQAFAQRMTASGDMDILWEIDAGIEQLVFPPRIRRNLFLIVKEAVTNAIKHSGSPIVRISMQIQHDVLTVEVRDAGRGLAGPRIGGYGLRTMQARAEKSGATLQIHAAPKTGTSVQLRCPLDVAG